MTLGSKQQGPATGPARTELPDEHWVRPRPDRNGYRADVILALVMLGLSVGSMFLYRVAGFYPEPADIPLSIALLAATSLVLAARRRFPLTVLVVTSAAFVATQTLQVPEIVMTNIILFITMYTAGAWTTNRRLSMVVRGLVILGMFIWLFVALATSPMPFLDRDLRDAPLSAFTAYSLISIVTNLLYFGGAYYFGDRAWASARAGVELQARSEELAVERERNAAQAVVRERMRIARDLHDVVAHHVSLMGVQAGAARRMVDGSPRKAAESLAAIEESARQAVDELHRMLGTLRETGDDAATGTTPLDVDGPSTLRLSSVPALVEHARSAGLDSTYRVVGVPREVPATVESTLFRVAQEAVTNTLKHASPSARLDVRLRYLDDAVELEVTDSGGAARAGASGAGLGLVGMRERIAAVGGTLETGPRARGGFLVRARISTAPSEAPRPSNTASDGRRADTAVPQHPRRLDESEIPR